MLFQNLGFKSNPFHIRPSPDIIGFQAERSRLVSLSVLGRLIWVRGRMGSGKTSILLWLFQELKKRKENVIFVPTYYKRKSEILKFLKSKVSIIERILFKRNIPKNSIVLIDECQDLEKEVVEYLRILWDENKLKSIIFAGTELNCSEFTKDRLYIIELKPLKFEELLQILEKRLNHKKVFELDAIKLLAEISEYVPRTFLKNCEKVFLESEKIPITEEDVRRILGIEKRIEGTIQEKILNLIKKKGPITAKEISEELGISIQSTWKHVSILYKKGLIKKIRGKPVKYILAKT